MKKQISEFLPKPKIIIEEDTKANLNELLEPFKNQEYLPVSIIQNLIKNAFITSYILHDYNSFHKIIKIKISDLLNAPITNWIYNRPPDLNRCNDIAKYIYYSKSFIDTMIYLSFNNNNKTFDVIDGIHRFTSLKIIKEHNSKPLDLITPSDLGNNNDANWLFDSYIIINLRINASEGELIELFKNLNKSNPIPDLYLCNANQEKKEIIEKSVKEWQNKYPSHFSSKAKPYKPNVNRDRFIDLLEIIYDKYDISQEKKDMLENLLDRTNTNISYNVPRKITKSKSINDKCVETGCWLFIYTIEELTKMI